tara:strand:+ start:4530 stop:5312 length:783 start_codon:yes stop_codon:yes gene_type:complete
MIAPLIKLFLFSILRPSFKRGGNRPIRELLKLPIIFDISSFLIQLRYIKRIINLESISKPSKYIKEVIEYNSSVTVGKLITRSRRAEVLYQISTLIINNLSDKKLLIVGPRNVQELYIAWLYGFNWENIQAIDLYSGHPKITVMNMHNLKFKDESFDCVVMANTLSYADDTNKVIKEVSRVLKPSGIFSFGSTFMPGDDQWIGNSINGEKIYKFLREANMKISFHYPEEKVNALGRNQTTNIFNAQKIDKNLIYTDNFTL